MSTSNTVDPAAEKRQLEQMGSNVANAKVRTLAQEREVADLREQLRVAERELVSRENTLRSAIREFNKALGLVE